LDSLNRSFSLALDTGDFEEGIKAGPGIQVLTNLLISNFYNLEKLIEIDRI
jgi:hypothetical protein